MPICSDAFAVNAAPPFWSGLPLCFLRTSPLVLSVLQKPLFEPIRDTSPDDLFGCCHVHLKCLNWLLSLVRSRSSFFTMTRTAYIQENPFLTKVISVFHLSKDMVLLTLCPAPVHPKKIAVHCLDKVRAIRVYLSETLDMGKTNSLFVISSGPLKHQLLEG